MSESGAYDQILGGCLRLRDRQAIFPKPLEVHLNRLVHVLLGFFTSFARGDAARIGIALDSRFCDSPRGNRCSEDVSVGFTVNSKECCLHWCTEYRWSFGDGTTGEGARVTHLFSSPGLYVVNVTGSDGVRELSRALLLNIEPFPGPYYLGSPYVELRPKAGVLAVGEEIIVDVVVSAPGFRYSLWASWPGVLEVIGEQPMNPLAGTTYRLRLRALAPGTSSIMYEDGFGRAHGVNVGVFRVAEPGQARQRERTRTVRRPPAR